MLRSLPVQKPEELAVLTSPAEFKGGRQSTYNSGGETHVFSYPIFRGLEKHQSVAVQGVAAFRNFGANRAYRGQTVDARC